MDVKDVSPATALDLYWRMLLSRRVEERLAEMYRAGLPGMLHLAIGQEAVAAGVCAALERDDAVLSTHRGKGHYIAKGGNLPALFAELMEKQTGSNRGKGGPMHILDPDVAMLGANGVVGASIAIACGVALAAKLRESSRVAVSFFGDGAVNSGPWHESLNLAALWKLPVVFVCENNLYQVAVPLARGSSVQEIAGRATAYGMPGVCVDGMNVFAVYAATREAVERARQGEGPTLLECATYRFRGHSEADPTCGLSYRSREEIAAWEKRCPLKQARQVLLEQGCAEEPTFDAMEERCRRMIDEAVAFAEQSPTAPAEWALTDVFAGE